MGELLKRSRRSYTPQIEGETAAGPAGADDRSYGKLFIAAAVLQLLQVALLFCPFAANPETGELIFFHLNMSGFIWLTILMSIAAIGLTILPVIRHTLRKRRRLALQKLVCLWFVVWAVFMWATGIEIIIIETIINEKKIVEISEIIAYLKTSGIITSLRVGFWLPLPVGLALFILLFVISHKSRRYQEKKPKKAESMNTL